MPAFLLRYLPHFLIVAAVLLGVWYLDHRGYERATKDRDAADAKLHAAIQKDILAFERRSGARENARAGETRATLETIARNTAAGQTRIIKEMTHEVRFTDPVLGIPERVRDEINRPFAPSPCARLADGGIRCSVPDAGAVGEH